MIRDKNGKIPAYVVRENTLLHQPTGLRVEINAQTSDFDAALRKAKAALDQKIRERNQHRA